MNKTNAWQPVIGLEIHAQLATKTKIFSPASTQFGSPPNTQACGIDLGLPGVLPVLNQQALKMAIQFGIAIEAEIGKRSVFARKNYFYPDLPKGYQISQYELPIVGQGKITITLADKSTKIIGITRAHLEEDAGKSLHENFINQSGVDLNRAGTPLLEIVSEPDLFSIEETIAYAKKMHSIVQYLRICDGNMQEGSFRMDANISLHKKGDPLGTRAEIKNINSFKFLEKALEYEIQRQSTLLDKGEKVIQETRLFDSEKSETRSMRTKEEANDYRYFPDPDLLPVIVSDEDIKLAAKDLPELPDARRERFQNQYQLTEYDAQVLTNSREIADFFENVCDTVGTEYKICANWVMGDFSGLLNQDNLYIQESPVSAEQLGTIIKRITDKTISGKIAKEIFEELWQNGGQVDEIIDKKGLRQITDSGAIEKMVDEVIAQNPDQVAAYRDGKDKLFGYFVGQIMKASQGKANPAEVNKFLKQKL
jgi:aspartyl-tRNA(Asn)/glutamyl-tRNA(Gln) amidotransferase subunit B